MPAVSLSFRGGRPGMTGYVLPLMSRLTGINPPRARPRHFAGCSPYPEAVMQKARSRAIARPAPVTHATAEIWTVALWLLALVFLLTTVRVY